MRRFEKISPLIVDGFSINAAYAMYYGFRVESGLIGYAIQPEFLLPMVALWIIWTFLFFLAGLYRPWYNQSRLDEILAVARATFLGALGLFVLIVFDDRSEGDASGLRGMIIGYWVVLTGVVATGRLLLRAVQRRFAISGTGARRTIVIGWSKRGFELSDMTVRFPALGYRVVGFVSTGKSKSSGGLSRKRVYKGIPLLGTLNNLGETLTRERVEEVLVGVGSAEHPSLIEVLKACQGRPIGVKILADLYDIVTGQARISSLYGVPLLDVQPQLMKPWEEFTKRTVDLVVAFLVLVTGFPLWLAVTLAVKAESPGPVFYRQERVGKGGRIFRIMKFRSMFRDAEKQSGPVWAGKNDPRVTHVGKFLRKTHLDEIPQFWNVLWGDMSLVGPRPERPFFVDKLSKEIPLYHRRLLARPGITGWAQIKHKYDESVDDVRTKVKYDLFYIENASWRFDLKILLNTLYVMLMRKGHT